MNEIKRTPSLCKCKIAIITFAAIAAVCAFTYSFSIVLPLLTSNRSLDGLTISSVLFRFIRFFEVLLPILFLFVCVFLFKKSGVVIVSSSLMFVVMAIGPAILHIYERIQYLLFFSTYDYGFNLIAILVFQLCPMIIYLLPTINSVGGFNRKAFAVAGIIGGFVIEIYYLVRELVYIYQLIFMWQHRVFISMIYDLFDICRILAVICFLIAALIFVAKNRVLCVNLSDGSESKINSVLSMPAKKALRILKDNYDYGFITEAEYNSYRIQIVNKL